MGASAFEMGRTARALLSSRSPDNYQLNMDHPGLSLLLSEWITSDFYSGPHLQHRDHPVNINFRALSLSLTPLLFLLGPFDKMFIHFKKQPSPLSSSPPHSRIFFCFDKHIQYSLYPPGLFWTRITTWMRRGGEKGVYRSELFGITMKYQHSASFFHT